MGKGFSRLGASSIFTLSAVVLSLGASLPAYAKKSIKVEPKHVSGEFIVRLRDSSAVNIQTSVFSSLQKVFGNNAVLSVKPFQTDKNLHVVRMARDSDVKGAIDRLSSDPAIEFAEPNYVVHAFDDGTPNDADFGKLWGMKNTGQTDSSGQTGTVGSDINVLPLWQQGHKGSKKVVVSIIDTGIEWSHPDLKGNVYTNAAEIAGNGKDDDNNGFIDDVHGWNFATNNNNSNDDHGHGSHCAGTIGGMGNNGQGVAGVNWEVTMMPVKFLDAQGGGTLQGAVDSINYARMMKVNVMSNSWGGGGFSQALFKAIQDARDAGILFVAAAGNESNNNDNSPTYPASYQVENVVSVAAIDNRDAIASFSNYGIRAVHVAAPGVRIFSTVKDAGYDTYSGTSMACPHVSGIAALLWASNPEWTFGEIKDRMIRTSEPVGGLKRKVMAKGRVSAYNAMHGIVPPSSDPDESAWIDVPMNIESDHPYKDKADLTFKIEQPNAKMIRVHFEKVDVENRYDHVTVEANGAIVEDISGAVTNYTTEYTTGNALTIRLKSDNSVTAWGFKIDKIQYIPQ